MKSHNRDFFLELYMIETISELYRRVFVKMRILNFSQDENSYCTCCRQYFKAASGWKYRQG